MEDLVGSVLPLVQALAPGFIVTTLFYWLSEAKKPTQFERTIQALIGTALISILVYLVEYFLLAVGRTGFHLGVWSGEVATGLSFVLAVALGFGLAHAANNDTLYERARKFGLTSRASYSEWVVAFRKYPGRQLVLHFEDQRRLIGYPHVWPSDPETGYFLMQYAAWIVDDKYQDIDGDFLLIDMKNVVFVEVLAQ